MGITAGVIGIAAAVPELAIGTATAGGLLGIVSESWSGSVGRTPGRVKWLRWALEWDLEQQASDAP